MIIGSSLMNVVIKSWFQIRAEQLSSFASRNTIPCILAVDLYPFGYIVPIQTNRWEQDWICLFHMTSRRWIDFKEGTGGSRCRQSNLGGFHEPIQDALYLLHESYCKQQQSWPKCVMKWRAQQRKHLLHSHIWRHRKESHENVSSHRIEVQRRMNKTRFYLVSICMK